MTFDLLITFGFLVASGLWLRQLVTDVRLKGVLRTALRNADNYKPGGRNIVIIPYNQLAQLMGWTSENFPMRDEKDFNSKPTPHPASESPTKRRKRRK